MASQRRQTVPISTNSPTVTNVSTEACLGAAPYWLPRLNALLYVDILGNEVRRLRNADKHNEVIAKLDKSISFIIPVEGTEDQYVAGQGHDIVLLRWDGLSQKPFGEVLVNVTKERKNVLAYGKVDPRGRLWTGTSDNLDLTYMTDAKDCALYCLSSGGILSRQLENVPACSDLEWSQDGKTLFLVDPTSSTVYAFDYDLERGAISNRQVIFDFKKNNVNGKPRGITIDEDGKLWVACFGGSRVVRVDPETSSVMKSLPVPCRDVTSVSFGGQNYNDLYITTSHARLAPGERCAFPGSGGTFRVTDLAVRGFPAREFRL